MNLRAWRWTAACVAAALIVAGCEGPARKVTLTTNPAGAQVNVSSDKGAAFSGRTQEGGLPCTLKFPSSGPSIYNVEFQLDGYQPATITIRKDSEQYDPKIVTVAKLDGRTDFRVELKRDVRTGTFTTNPAGAQVSISSDKGAKESLGKTQESGLAYTLKFSSDPAKGPGAYNVDFQLDGYQPVTIVIKKDTEQYDPTTVTATKGDDRTDFRIDLKRELVREIPILVPTITAQGYTIKPGTVRAWVEDIEREAMGASNILKVAAGQSISGMAISADGNTLVFSLAEVVLDDKGKKKEVASMRSIQTKGGGMTQVTSGQWSDTFPTLTADGKLLFCSDRLRDKKADIFRISISELGAIAVIYQTAEGINYQPSTASNGVIAYTYNPQYLNSASGSNQIWTLGGENRYPTQLREGSMPAVSPDGAQIAYIGPDGQLWRVPVNGQNPVQLTNTAIQKEGKKHPGWSPDGKHILYASDEGRDKDNEPNYDIWMIREDGTGTRQLTTNGSTDDYPVVSPDEKYVYFVSNRGFKEGIWRIPFPASDVSPTPQPTTAPR
jgi:Tol biopolymer transport system component